MNFVSAGQSSFPKESKKIINLGLCHTVQFFLQNSFLSRCKIGKYMFPSQFTNIILTYQYHIIRNINWSGNFSLRVGQSSCSGFVSLIFLIFSFHLLLAPCIKTDAKTQNFKIFRGSMPPDFPRGSRAEGASRANSCPPP